MATKAYDPKKKYIYMTMPGGKKVAMERSAALALRRKRGVAQTSSMIPGNLRPLVDAGAIHDAVNSSLSAANTPILAQQADAERQLGSNLEANRALGTQTAAHIAEMLAGAQQRTQSFMQTSAQAQAAAQAQDAASAQAMGAMLGHALNPNVAAVADAGTAPGQAQRFADNTGNLWGLSLGSQAQQDYFQRAGAIAAMNTAGFEREQRGRLADVLSALKAQVAANNAKRGELTRQFAQEDYTLASAFQSGLAEQQLEQAKLGLDQYANETDRMNVLADAENDARKAGAGLTTQQAKNVAAVRKAVDVMVSKLRKPLKTTVDKETGNVSRTYPTAAEVFGAGGGPWREAFKRLTADAGLSPAQAALRATMWFPDSISRSSPKKIVTMLKNRGVPQSIIKQIVDGQWGKGSYTNATSRPSATRPSPGQQTRPNQSGGTTTINPNVTEGGGSTVA